ncbi:MAG: LPS export ABC transporter periplasmic protein LptC [Deltaproteobacteria bacterium]|nr:LPS export ABC transporter periplasmic protein LptC [Deltaproteobacteria bacterium]
MKRLKLAFALLILIVMSVMGYLLYRNIDLIVKDESPVEFAKEGADYSLTAPQFIEMDGDRIVLEVKAREASYFKEDDSAHLVKPRIEYLGRDNKKFVIVGNRGKVFTERNIVLLDGDVRLSTSDGYLLETPSVEYRGNEKIAYTDKKVRIRGGGFDIKGAGFEADMENEKFRINKNVEALFDESIKEQAPD